MIRKGYIQGGMFFLLVFAGVELHSYTYEFYNYRRSPVEVQVETASIFAPKPKKRVPAAKRVTEYKTISKDHGKKSRTRVEVLKPGHEKISIGGIHVGTCFKKLKIDGKKAKLKGFYQDQLCGPMTFGIVKDNMAYTDPKEIPEEILYAEWPVEE